MSTPDPFYPAQATQHHHPESRRYVGLYSSWFGETELTGMSALTRNRASKTVPNDIMREYYVQRAQGGAGLIVTEGVLITRQGSTRLWAQSYIDGWKQIVDAVHATGSKIYAQLWHLGRVSHPDAPEQIAAGVPVYGPSAISARGGGKFRFIDGEPGYVTPTELPDPKTIIGGAISGGLLPRVERALPERSRLRPERCILGSSSM
ncbi:hypothetical protein C8F01DRAFT_1262443 [Mycena amicta]|nr:hypothetical protein C8F01DRAFT_1262403 [Mycena amicta]KAJ7051929.1 hypothetical protein C8F01DRAFT_1262443 [Mycena amicta]